MPAVRRRACPMPHAASAIADIGTEGFYIGRPQGVFTKGKKQKE